MPVDSSPQVAAKKSREDLLAYKSVDYSGFIERLFARGADFLLDVGIGYVFYRWTNLSISIIMALIFDLIIRVLMTYYLGATVGKFIFGVRVISRCSARLSIWQVVIRELSKYISGLFLNLGYISIIVSRRKRAWHDIIACTAVTSGGREEALYGMDVYAKRPEKWDIRIGGLVTGIFVVTLLISINKGAGYLLDGRGMIGFTKIMDTKTAEFKYYVPSPETGFIAVSKNIVQVGDVDGDRGYEVFKEGIIDDKPAIRDVRLTAIRPVYGEISLTFDKNIIQYRLLDMDGDKKDEIAVLFEDKNLKIYKPGAEVLELASYGPVDYGNINAVVKGKPEDNMPYRLYILGDKNKLTVISMKDGKIDGEVMTLPDSYNFTSIDRGILNGEDCLIGATDDQRLVFYDYEGGYKKTKEMRIPVKGMAQVFIKDIDSDDNNEVILSYPMYEGRTHPVMAAYDVSGDDMRLIWYGGKSYKSGDKSINIAYDDGMDVDGDDKFEVYMVSKEVSGKVGKITLFLFQGEEYMFKANEFLRMLSLSKPM